MATPSKTGGSTIFSLANVATGASTPSSIFAVTTKFQVAVGIWIGRTSNTAPTTALQVRIEGAIAGSGSEDGFWQPIAVFNSSINAITSEAVTTSSASGQAVVSMSTTTGMSLSDLVYIKNTSIGNGEFQVIKTITSSTSITLEDNLVHTQATSSTVYPNAQRFLAVIDVGAFIGLRVVFNNNNGGVGFDCQAFVNTLDSIS